MFVCCVKKLKHIRIINECLAFIPQIKVPLSSLIFHFIVILQFRCLVSVCSYRSLCKRSLELRQSFYSKITTYLNEPLSTKSARTLDRLHSISEDKGEKFSLKWLHLRTAYLIVPSCIILNQVLSLNFL